MSNNYHTALLTGQSNAAATFNTPLGALDAAISQVAGSSSKIFGTVGTGDTWAAHTTTTTVATSALSKGDTSLVVASGSNISAGMMLHLTMDDASNFVSKVYSISGSGSNETIKLLREVPGAAAIGNNVRFYEADLVLGSAEADAFTVQAPVYYFLNDATINYGTVISGSGTALKISVGDTSGTIDAGTLVGQLSDIEYLAAVTANGGATAPTLQTNLLNLNRNIYFPEMYGTIGGGSDEDAINAAITAAATATGGIVALTANDYSIDGTILVGNNVTLCGMGQNGTEIAYTGAGVAIASADTSAARQRIILENFYLSTSTGTHGIQIAGMKWCVYRNIQVDGFSTVGIYLDAYNTGCWWNYLDNVRVNCGTEGSPQGIGILLGSSYGAGANNSNNNYITGLAQFNTTAIKIASNADNETGNANTIYNFDFEDNTTGFEEENAGAIRLANSVRDCRFESNTTHVTMASNPSGLTGLETCAFVLPTSVNIINRAGGIDTRTNFVVNGGFEENQNGWLGGWNVTGVGGQITRTGTALDSISTGVHDGGDASANMTDGSRFWYVDQWNNWYVENTTDGSYALITDTTVNTLTTSLAGGTDNDWDDNDVYDIYIGGKHTSTNNNATLADDNKDWGADELKGLIVENITDGSSSPIKTNTYRTVTCTLTGGTDNDFDTNDVYKISESSDTERFSGNAACLVTADGSNIAFLTQSLSGYAWFQNMVITLTAMVKHTAVSDETVDLYITDGVGTSRGAAHSAGSDWELLRVERPMNTAASELEFGLRLSTNTATSSYSAYIDNVELHVGPAF